MNRQDKKILRDFQCDYNRNLEEEFAQTFSEKDDVRLFFINENQAFTDGKNIVVDPSCREIFQDRVALFQTEQYLEIPTICSDDSWAALRMITRGQTIHECLHLLYTDFPLGVMKDPRCDNRIKKTTMSLIANIIEDAYIEAVGCSIYDNIELVLQFTRISMLFAKKKTEGTVAQVFAAEKTVKTAEAVESDASVVSTGKKILLAAYLNYMVDFLLYPMVKQEEPPMEIADFVAKTKDLFLQGSIAPTGTLRYAFSQKIFDIILPLIPEDEDDLDIRIFASHLWGMKTHSPQNSTMGKMAQKGRRQEVAVRLFTNLNHDSKEKKDFSEDCAVLIKDIQKHKIAALDIISYEGTSMEYTGKDFNCSVLHKDIKINVTKPKINLNLRKAYQNIYHRYRININSYNSRFAQLLNANVSTREENQFFGAGISSRYLGDMKKRFWYCNTQESDIPDLSVLLLIDGSGSMRGRRRESAMMSSVVLHEVMKKQGMLHSITEHRGCFFEPEIDVNILVGFHSKEEEKYNLMQIDAYGDNRDGLALFWAERYINEQTDSENKLIIVLSDGVPAHAADDYYPPISTKDTANAVKKISQRGTKIIAVALDDDESFRCYDELKEIYPNIIACNDLKRLTGQLLKLISKELQ